MSLSEQTLNIRLKSSALGHPCDEINQLLAGQEHTHRTVPRWPRDRLGEGVALFHSSAYLRRSDFAGSAWRSRSSPVLRA
jgi:hypothetical protein